MSNRRGQEGMTLGTVVGIILLVLLLVVVIFSFTSAGRDFWAKTLNLKGGTTLDSAVQGCNIAASSNAVDSFCSELKSVSYNGTTQYVTCGKIGFTGVSLESSLSCDGATQKLRNNCIALKKTNIRINNVLIENENNCNDLSA